MMTTAIPAKAETGWVTANGNTYYYDASGNICKGLTQINEEYYYFNGNGVMQTGVLILDKHIFYFNEAGVMQIGDAILPDGVKYHFDPNGALTVETPGWQTINGSSYYFRTTNEVETGWKKVNDYYVNDIGERMEGVIARGIDVSRYQGQINWSQVAADDVSFAFIRVGSVKYGVDVYYDINMKAANAAGIKSGIYVYSYATTPEEAVAEADFVLANIKNYQVGFPIAIDVEDSVHKSLSPQQLSAVVKAFCDRIEEYGYQPILYSSTNWYRSSFDMSALSGIRKWVAQYYHYCAIDTRDVWQATSSATINGISGRVDLNYLYTDFSSLIPANGWVVRAGNWFYFRDYRKQTGWLLDGNTYYFLNYKGAMQIGWLLYNNQYYYLNQSGAMQTGWATVDRKRYYFDNSGIMQTGWKQIQGDYYYFAIDGSM